MLMTIRPERIEGIETAWFYRCADCGKLLVASRDLQDPRICRQCREREREHPGRRQVRPEIERLRELLKEV